MSKEKTFNSHYEGNVSVCKDTKDRVSIVANPNGKFSNKNIGELIQAMEARCAKLSKEMGKTIVMKTPWTPKDQIDNPDREYEIMVKYADSPYLAYRVKGVKATSGRRQVIVFDD
tara:strand:+ start:83 stop:427 length:345 start_codon:yes stop_codon:yes gene_type:complete